VDGATNTWPSTVANKMKLQYAVELQTGSFGIATPLFVVMNQARTKSSTGASRGHRRQPHVGREKTIATWVPPSRTHTQRSRRGAKVHHSGSRGGSQVVETYLRVQAESAKELDAKGIPGTQILETLQQALAENAG
jgi:hypothetical protein